MEVRKCTNEIIDLMEEGVIDPMFIATSLLEWLSEDDVEEFGRYYDLLDDDDDYEEDEFDEDEEDDEDEDDEDEDEE